MNTVENVLNTLSAWIWQQPYLMILLVGTGIFLSIRLLFLQFRALPYALKLALWPHRPPHTNTAAHGDISHFAALMTALSATIGTGNIAGVATAVVLGGPGAVFWMWITAVFGMATKYAEGILAVKYRVTDSKGEMSGGPMYYIELGMKQKWLAVLFALFATLASFGIGSSVQSNSVAASLEAGFGLPPAVTGIILTILTGVVVLGGIKSIARASSLIVPFMAVIYVAGGLLVILLHTDLIMPAFKLIFASALDFQAAGGAAVGLAIRYGVARGLFSNEAGMGSAPIAAAAAITDHPARQALVSMTGTFLDTIIVCTITGLVLTMGFIADSHSYGGLSGAALTIAKFDTLLPGGGWIVIFGMVFFAYSTILGWCYYGEKCCAYLFGDRAVTAYRIVYVLTVLLGTLLSLDLVWTVADIFNGLMAVPNLIGLLFLSGVVVRETRDFYARRRSGELY